MNVESALKDTRNERDDQPNAFDSAKAMKASERDAMRPLK